MRQKLLTTLITATPSLYAAAEAPLHHHQFSAGELHHLAVHDLNPMHGDKLHRYSLDFRHLTPSLSPLGHSLTLDLTGYGQQLKDVILPTSASNVRLPSGVKVIFIGNVAHLDLSKVQADSKLFLDLKGVIGMDQHYAANGRNAVPSFVDGVVFPANATEISVPTHVKHVSATGAKTVHLHGNSFNGIPHSLIHMPELSELNLRTVPTREATVNVSRLSNVTTLHLNPHSPAKEVRLHGEKVVELKGAHGIGHVQFTSPHVTKAAVDAVRTHTHHVEVLHPSADHAAILSHRLDLHRRGDTTAEKDAVVAAIQHMGITNVKHLKLKAAHLSYVMEKLGVSDFTGFTHLEKLEIVDAAGHYASAMLQDEVITKLHLPASIKEFYSKNSVVVKGAMESGALDSKFNAKYVDLSEATGITTLSDAAGFMPPTIRHFHLPAGLDLSVEANRTFVKSLVELTHLYLYGTSDIAGLQVGDMPISVTHLDISKSSAEAVIPAFGVNITHVTVSAAYLAADAASNKFVTFANFEGAGKTLLVNGSAANASLSTANIPNVSALDLRAVTGATGFSNALNKNVNNSLEFLFMPSEFDVTAAAGNILANPDGEVMVYFSGAYSGNQVLGASYNNAMLNFSAVTGGGLFQIPADTRELVLSSGVGGVSSGGVAATANEFDLFALTQLRTLNGLPTTAAVLRLNNSAGIAFALDLSAHNHLTELSLSASRLSSVHLPSAASGLSFGSGSSGHLNLSGITGLEVSAEHPNPIRGLGTFTKAANAIQVISLPRSMPADTHVDLSDIRSSVHMRNLHKAERVTPHAIATHLVKHTHHHGVHDRTNVALWQAYLEEMLYPTLIGGLAQTSLDLSETHFSGDEAEVQAQLNAFFTALDSLTELKGTVQNIHLRIANALNAGTLELGRTNSNAHASGLNPNLRISVHKEAGLNVFGVVDDPIAHTAEMFADTMPANLLTADAAEWQTWIETQAEKGSTHLDLTALAFEHQNELDAFFAGLDAADGAVKGSFTRIDLRFDGNYQDGAGGDEAVLGRAGAVPATGLHAALKVFTHNKALSITGAGGQATEIRTADIFNDTMPAVTDLAAVWRTWIETQAEKGSTHLDLTAVEFASQAQLDAFFAGLHAADGAVKGSFTRIDLKFAAAYGDVLIDAHDVEQLHADLKVFVEGGGALNGFDAGGGPNDEVATANIAVSDSTEFDRTRAHEWHSYIMHHLGQGHSILDLKEVTIASNPQAAALQTALASLPPHTKDRLRGIVVKLAGGNNFGGESTFNMNLTGLGLSALEYFIVDLNRTTQGGGNVTANITKPDSVNVISINPHDA